MSKGQENLITAIDVGSAKTAVLVARAGESGLRYVSHGIAESRGSRKGAIVDLEKAIASLHRAVGIAEHGGTVNVERGVVGIAGAHIRGLNSRGGISLGG